MLPFSSLRLSLASSAPPVRPLWQRLLIALAILVIIFIVAVLSVDSSRYTALVDPLIVKKVRASGSLITLQKTSFGVFPPAYRAESITLIPRGWFSGLLFSDAEIRPSLFSLLGSSPRASIRTRAYSGEISGQLGASTSAQQLSATLQAHSLQLSEHPVLEGLGIRAGQLDFTSQAFTIINNEPSSGTFRLELSAVDKPEASEFSLQNFGLPLTLNLPSFSKLQLKLDCKASEGALDCAISMNSSLLDVQGEAKTFFSRSDFSKVDANLRVGLHEAGSAAFGNFLPLVSSGALKSDARDFTLTLSASPRSQNFVFKALPPGK